MLNWSVNLNPYRLSPTLDPAEMDAAAARLVPRLVELGVTMVRIDLLWAFLIPKRDELDGAAVLWMTRFLDTLAIRGITTYGILYNPADWACELAHQDERAFIEAWRRYVALCAGAFGDRVAIWQVWNEPNNYFSHVKDDFNLFTHRLMRVGGWEVDLPVSVRWEALAKLFEAARQELGTGARIATNFLANMGNMAPVSFPDWVEWDVFLERMMERLHEQVDVLAIDHYPDTWIPGTGPLEWEPLEVLIRMVRNKRSACHGKAVVVGEIGYSSCRNAALPLGFKLFPEDHDEHRMADWYAHALPHVASLVGPAALPDQDIHVINLYELIDAETDSIVGTMDLVDIEYHFGLLRADGMPKPAFDLVRQLVAGESPVSGPSWRRSGPLQVYLEASRMSRGMHRWVGPKILALYKTVTPPMRRHDRAAIGIGVLLAIIAGMRRGKS